MGLLDALGRGWTNLVNNVEAAPPESWQALGTALAGERDLGRGLASGIGAFQQKSVDNIKRKGLASAFDSMAAEIPESQRPIFQQMVQNNPEALMQGYAGQLFAKPAEQPSGVKEYLFAVSNDGYKGTFTDFQRDLKRAGASNTTVNVGGEKAFEQGVGKYQAEAFGAMASAGIDANSQLSVINRLEKNLDKLPGGIIGGIQNLASSFGIKLGPNADAVEAANSIISKLVPEQRGPGTGPMSDRDIVLFQDSLPKLINTPEGNRIIVQTMRGLAQYKRAQAEIAVAAMNGQITRQEAQAQLMQLPDPFEAFKSGGGAAPGPKVYQYNPASGRAE